MGRVMKALIKPGIFRAELGCHFVESAASSHFLCQGVNRALASAGTPPARMKAQHQQEDSPVGGTNGY